MQTSSLVALIGVVVGLAISGGHGAAIKEGRQQQVVTLANQSTPSVVSNTPELVPAVVDPNPTTVAPITTTTAFPTTTVKPEDGDDDDSSEEEEEDADENEDAEEDNDDEQEEEGEPTAKQIYLPGYLTTHGELLVPIDAVQRGTGGRVHYEVIEDPTYPAYAQFANNVAASAELANGGSSAGGVGSGDVDTVLDILQQPGQPPVSASAPNDVEPSEEEDKSLPTVVEQANNKEQQRHLWIGGSNPTDFGFHF